MSDPRTWPTTPPTEPGWYWCIRRIEPEVVRVEFREHMRQWGGGGLIFAAGISEGVHLNGRAFKHARWRPDRLEP